MEDIHIKRISEDFGPEMLFLLEWCYARDERLDYPTHRVYIGDDFLEVYEIPKEKIRDALLSPCFDYKRELLNELTDDICCWAGAAPDKICHYTDLQIVFYKNKNTIIHPAFWTDGDLDFEFFQKNWFLENDINKHLWPHAFTEKAKEVLFPGGLVLRPIGKRTLAYTENLDLFPDVFEDVFI